ncbi:MAG: hypothetical protein AAGD43_33995 [Pseudomonadota bacterium]
MFRLIILIAFAAVLSLASGGYAPLVANKLPGRLLTYHKVFDVWWDVACDTAPDGTDARCYAQYVDVYSPRPNLRAAIVDFLYRRGSDGQPEPIITFNIEPGLSYARDAEMLVVHNDGTTKPIDASACPTAKCVFTGQVGREMLDEWAGAKTLILLIREKSGKTVERRWPLGNMAEMISIIAEQRKKRGLP